MYLASVFNDNFIRNKYTRRSVARIETTTRGGCPPEDHFLLVFKKKLTRKRHKRTRAARSVFNKNSIRNHNKRKRAARRAFDISFH